MRCRIAITFILCALLDISTAHAQLPMCPGQWENLAGLIVCRCSDGSFADSSTGVQTCSAEPSGVFSVPDPQALNTVTPLPYPKLGLKLLPAPEGQTGVLVNEVAPDSEAELKGIRPGSIITSVHLNAVTEPRDVIANVTRAYREGRGAVMMKIDDVFVAIPFSDRKGQRLAKRQPPPVLLVEPRPVIRPTLKAEPAAEPAAQVKPTRPGEFIEASQFPQSLNSWLPIILALMTGALLAPHLARGFRFVADRRRSPAAVPGTALISTQTASIVTPPAQPVPAPILTRDTPRALESMKLALAYLDEFDEAGAPDPENKTDRQNRLNTLSLVTKQLNAAERHDPDAILEHETEDGTQRRWSINELKAQALLVEAITHQYYDLSRSIPPLLAATKLDPHNATCFFVLGSIHLQNRNRADAIAALSRAVELAPHEMTYRKELDRAQSLTGMEVASYKATRAGERVFDAGIATANAGIMAWNIFAFVWNIVTLPVRLMLALHRWGGR